MPHVLQGVDMATFLDEPKQLPFPPLETFVSSLVSERHFSIMPLQSNISPPKLSIYMMPL
jgi:hypothetical protein